MSPTTKAPPPSDDRPLALLVDDHRDTSEMYGEWLVFSGFRVVHAATVDEALQMTHDLGPHVIATDIGLNGSDGCDLCARIKEDARTKAIPVVAFTAWTMGGHMERARRAGCDAVLMKPCSPQDLVAEMLRLLNLPGVKVKE